jgi:hypothetical protein
MCMDGRPIAGTASKQHAANANRIELYSVVTGTLSAFFLEMVAKLHAGGERLQRHN